MTSPGLFVALVRAGGLLLGVHGFVAATSIGVHAFSRDRELFAGTFAGSIALTLIGFGLVVVAPAIARLLRWPDVPKDSDPLPPAAERRAISAWSVGARAVACLAIIQAVDPLARLVESVVERESFFSPHNLVLLGTVLALGVSAVVLVLLGRTRRAPLRATR